MLEILALVFITRKIGALAIQKGLSSGRWKFYTVLTWFLAEFAGLFLGLFIIGMEMPIVAALLGYGLAIISILILRAALNNKPDVALDTFDFDKQDENSQFVS
ncbi:hypothetical protein DBR32_00415 [Taibaiella sp. KBW10]|uniref:hypothetical protein n=1 Tax=Taibaiella sp. KBW10 TaxID=2153357 RepID=UPI000F5A71AD|nr:hypothetical protein [Taibaiella sp. KBW10]RQO32112.1 hypothetical protein DBR32_00415 [Taibaiella sp. KBW10]